MEESIEKLISKSLIIRYCDVRSSLKVAKTRASTPIPDFRCSSAGEMAHTHREVNVLQSHAFQKEKGSDFLP